MPSEALRPGCEHSGWASGRLHSEAAADASIEQASYVTSALLAEINGTGAFSLRSMLAARAPDFWCSMRERLMARCEDIHLGQVHVGRWLDSVQACGGVASSRQFQHCHGLGNNHQKPHGPELQSL